MAARAGKYYVYIVRCKDGTFYTGYTNDLKHRLKLHNSGNGAKYVRGKGPVRLVWCKEYRYYKRAVQEEVRIKKLRQYQKEQLINAFQKRIG